MKKTIKEKQKQIQARNLFLKYQHEAINLFLNYQKNYLTTTPDDARFTCICIEANKQIIDLIINFYNK